MPRTKTSLTPSEYAVLGLLRRRPAYGYELQRHLAPDASLGRVCPVEPAMVYAILKSLAGLELIDGRWDSSQYPPKAVYAATAEGDADFHRWLRHPVGRMREVKLDFLIKLYFALEEGRDFARDLVEAQIGVCLDYEARVDSGLMSVIVGSFDEFVFMSKVSAARATREWLTRCLESLSG